MLRLTPEEIKVAEAPERCWRGIVGWGIPVDGRTTVAGET